MGVSDTLERGLMQVTERCVGRSILERLEKLPTRLNEFGYDPFGFRPDLIKYAILPCYFFYKYYFRVETHYMGNIPQGRVLLVSNHAGQVPIDGFLIGSSILIEAEPPRLIRSMIERWAPTLPFVSQFFTRFGQIVGTPENCTRLLENDEAILVFPEGVKGINKLFNQRYQLQEFGHGFMRLALKSDAPIVPIAVIGSEEQAPSLYNFKPLANLLGFPAFPITPTFPLLGPLGALPYPVRYRIYFGEPMRFSGDPDEDDTEIEKKVQAVKTTIQSMIYRGLKKRRHVFW
jgi:1-acyl-sn-glycerol-3-phosphate acyltransferase